MANKSEQAESDGEEFYVTRRTHDSMKMLLEDLKREKLPPKAVGIFEDYLGRILGNKPIDLIIEMGDDGSLTTNPIGFGSEPVEVNRNYPEFAIVNNTSSDVSLSFPKGIFSNAREVQNDDTRECVTVAAYKEETLFVKWKIDKLILFNDPYTTGDNPDSFFFYVSFESGPGGSPKGLIKPPPP